MEKCLGVILFRWWTQCFFISRAEAPVWVGSVEWRQAASSANLPAEFVPWRDWLPTTSWYWCDNRDIRGRYSAADDEMETSTWKLVSSTQYALPVVLVVVLAVVVFALGFRSSVEPPSIAYFEQDKKPTTKKSKKQVRTLPWNMYL